MAQRIQENRRRLAAQLPRDAVATVQEPRVRVALAIIALVMLGSLLAGCHPVPNASRSSPDADSSIDIGVTASAAEPLPTLSDGMKAEITTLAEQSTAPGHAMVRIVSTEGVVAERDVTPLRSPTEVEHSSDARKHKIAQAVSDIDAVLRTTVATVPGLDPLRVLDRLSLVPGSRLYLLTSGASTENPIDIRQLGWEFDPNQVADSVVRQGQLPHLDHHRHVTLIGLGMTAGSQPSLSPAQRDQVTALWLRLCEKTGVTCDTAPADGRIVEPTATQPVPLIPIPASVTDASGCPVWNRLGDDVLRFQPDSAVLDEPEADTVLRPIVEAAQRCHRVISVLGFIADTGDGRDDSNLSGRRAAAVAARLVALGLPAELVGPVMGRGTADPIVSDVVAGHFDPERAALNRRVELSYRPM